MPYVGISGTGNRFSEYEGGTSHRESRKDQETMTVSTLSGGLGKVNGKTLVYNNGHSASSLHEGVMQRHNCVTQGAKNRTGLVGAESGFEQRAVHTVHCPTAFVYIRKMGGKVTVTQKMNQVCKELWEFLIENGITITVEQTT